MAVVMTQLQIQHRFDFKWAQ